MFANDHPDVTVYVVQAESDFLRQQQQAQLTDVQKAHRKASRFVRRLAPGPTRVLGEALVNQLNAQLRDSIGDATGGSTADEPDSRLSTSVFGSDSSAEDCSTFTAKIRDMATELSKTDAESIEKAVDDRQGT